MVRKPGEDQPLPPPEILPRENRDDLGSQATGPVLSRKTTVHLTRDEAALAESRGRVAGPSGAAAKLGIPPSTLDSRIKALKIDKSKFKFGRSYIGKPNH